MDSRGYYKTLEVKEDATSDEIKKAYRKLALQYHPDKNNGDKSAEARFKEIGEAYAILSDENKRREYDNPGYMDSFFSKFGFGFPGFKRPQRPPNRPMRGSDLKRLVEMPLHKFIFGGKESFEVTITDICLECNGIGAKTTEMCPNCGGSGRARYVEVKGNMHFTSETICGVCGGHGFKGVDECDKCGGKGNEDVKRSISFELPKGIKDGQVLVLNGKGRRGMNGGPSGDYHIICKMILPREEDLTDEQIEVLKSL